MVLSSNAKQETADDLRRAYREYAKASDERLVFDDDHFELSFLGREMMLDEWGMLPSKSTSESEEYWNALFEYDNMFASHEKQVREDRYWKVLKERIDAFVATEKGHHQAAELHETLWYYTMSNMFHDGYPSDDLYERVVMAELCWRAQIRATHKAKFPELYEWEPSMMLDIIETFNPDKSVKSMERLTIPASHTFEQFGELLSHQSGLHCPGTDIWYYENPKCDNIYSQTHFKAITEATYPNLKKLLTEVPIREGREVHLLLWHESQIEYVRRDMESILQLGILDLNRKGPVGEELEREFATIEAAVMDGSLMGISIPIR